MKNDTENNISKTETNQTIRHVPQEDSLTTATDEEVLASSEKLLRRNKHAYEELAK